MKIRASWLETGRFRRSRCRVPQAYSAQLLKKVVGTDILLASTYTVQGWRRWVGGGFKQIQRPQRLVGCRGARVSLLARFLCRCIGIGGSLFILALNDLGSRPYQSIAPSFKARNRVIIAFLYVSYFSFSLGILTTKNSNSNKQITPTGHVFQLVPSIWSHLLYRSCLKTKIEVQATPQQLGGRGLGFEVFGVMCVQKMVQGARSAQQWIQAQPREGAVKQQ